jgi:hypothetical protein
MAGRDRTTRTARHRSPGRRRALCQIDLRPEVIQPVLKALEDIDRRRLRPWLALRHGVRFNVSHRTPALRPIERQAIGQAGRGPRAAQERTPRSPRAHAVRTAGGADSNAARAGRPGAGTGVRRPTRAARVVSGVRAPSRHLTFATLHATDVRASRSRSGRQPSAAGSSPAARDGCVPPSTPSPRSTVDVRVPGRLDLRERRRLAPAPLLAPVFSRRALCHARPVGSAARRR